MNWDSWIGPAPYRDYHKGLHLHDWHDWWDFGNGSLGNSAPHSMDGPYWSMKLEHPASIVVEEMEGGSDERFPTCTRIRYDFPARGDMPAAKLYWYDGKTKGAKDKGTGETADSVAPTVMNRPPLVAEMEKKHKRNLGGNGAIYVGDKGMMCTGWYGDGLGFLPPEMKDQVPSPEKTIPRVSSSFADFIQACKTGGKTAAGFDYSAKLTEVIVLGCIAIKAGVGKKLEWDGPNMKITNMPELNKWLQRPEYRKGWELPV
jgi:hypothetical protein